MIVEAYYVTRTSPRGREIEEGRGTFDTTQAYRETKDRYYFRDDETGFVDIIEKDARIVPVESDDKQIKEISEIIYS